MASVTEAIPVLGENNAFETETDQICEVVELLKEDGVMSNYDLWMKVGLGDS